MSDTTNVGLSFSSEGLVSSPSPSSPSPQTHEKSANDPIRISNDNLEGFEDEVCVGSLDKFLSFSSNRRVKRLTWQRSLLELDKNLQKICGPPSTGSNEFVSHSLCNSPVNLYKPFIRTNSVRNNDNSKDENNCKKMDYVTDEAHNSSFSLQMSITPPKSYKPLRPKYPLSRSDSLWESTFQKFVPVRHIETHNKLHDQLLKITRGNKIRNNPSLSESKNDISSSASTRHDDPSNNFESYCNGEQIADFEIDFQRIGVEDLTVQIDKSGFEVEVRYRQISENSSDSKSKKLKSQHKINHNCFCLLKKDGCLRIYKGSNDIVDISYHLSCGHFYLPVVKGDDTSSGEYTISFFVPEELNFEDLSVKTVDDYLHVSGQKRRYSANYVQHNFNNSTLSDKPLESSTQLHKILDGPPNEPQQFHIKLRLPGTVDTRSVFSYMNHHHIFVIKTDGKSK